MGLVFGEDQSGVGAPAEGPFGGGSNPRKVTASSGFLGAVEAGGIVGYGVWGGLPLVFKDAEMPL